MRYVEIERQILGFSHDGAEVFAIGRTVLGRRIYCVKVGSNFGPSIIIQYSIHAREHITALLALQHVKDALGQREAMFGRIYFVPCLNPDGVALSLEGLTSVDNAQRAPSHIYNPLAFNSELKRFLLQINGSKDFSLWKANALAVDLNVNFDARWSEGLYNKLYPSSESYVGTSPNSERETQAIISLTRRVAPIMTISYHSKGEEIYYKFGQDRGALKRDQNIAKEFSHLTSYSLRDTFGSSGGYKDWCIEKLHIPAFTFEVGADSLSHPILAEHLPEIYKRNKNIPSKALQLALEV